MTSPIFTSLLRIFTARRNARIASAVLATAIPSVCPSVCQTPVLCQNECTWHGAVCTVRQQNVSSSVESKKYSPGTIPPLKSLFKLTYPLLIAASLDTFCLVAPQELAKKSSTMTNRKSYTGFPTSHQPRFYAAPNFVKMGIKYLNLSSLGQFRQ